MEVLFEYIDEVWYKDVAVAYYDSLEEEER